MSDYKTILYEIGGPNDSVCRITMNRPEKYIAIQWLNYAPDIQEMMDAFRQDVKS